jgi:hypothetical protein
MPFVLIEDIVGHDDERIVCVDVIGGIVTGVGGAVLGVE